MTAASEGHISIVRLFLQHNANTELKDSQGWKASDHAVIHGHHRLGSFFDTGIPLQSQGHSQKKKFMSEAMSMVNFPSLVCTVVVFNFPPSRKKQQQENKTKITEASALICPTVATALK